MAKRRESQIAAVSQAMTQAHYDVLLFLFLEKKKIHFKYQEQRFFSAARLSPSTDSGTIINNWVTKPAELRPRQLATHGDVVRT